jgi:small subunit ribosomal protein S17
MSKRTFEGKVVSTAMQKTAVVAVNVPKKHKTYGKSIKLTKKFMARNDKQISVGDLVKIEEARPFSGRSSWVVIEKLEEK